MCYSHDLNECSIFEANLWIIQRSYMFKYDAYEIPVRSQSIHKKSLQEDLYDNFRHIIATFLMFYSCQPIIQYV